MPKIYARACARNPLVFFSTNDTAYPPVSITPPSLPRGHILCNQAYGAITVQSN